MKWGQFENSGSKLVSSKKSRWGYNRKFTFECAFQKGTMLGSREEKTEGMMEVADNLEKTEHLLCPRD